MQLIAVGAADCSSYLMKVDLNSDMVTIVINVEKELKMMHLDRSNNNMHMIESNGLLFVDLDTLEMTAISSLKSGDSTVGNRFFRDPEDFVQLSDQTWVVADQKRDM